MLWHCSDVNVMEKNIGKSISEGNCEKVREKRDAASEKRQLRPEISPRAARLIERIASLDIHALERLIEQIGRDDEP